MGAEESREDTAADEAHTTENEPLDPELLRAADEVDVGLLSWFSELSPRERLRACSNFAKTVGKFRRVSSQTS
jgi:hypothetical protein